MSITIECLGDPDFYYDSEDDDESNPNYKKPDDCDGKRKVYTLDKLPGRHAIFIIKNGELEIELNYSLWSLTEKKLMDFYEALITNGTYTLRFEPGSNSSSYISTKDGTTTFSLMSAGGSEPCFMDISVPNICCIDSFKNLIKND